MQDFRKLKVWRRAHALSVQIRTCARAIPQPGNTEFKTQLARAADSIANNIVEGSSAATRKEFARYLDISIKSTSEVEYQLQSARDNALLQRRTCRALMIEVREIRMMLFGLRRTVLAADAEEQRRAAAMRQPRTFGRPRNSDTPTTTHPQHDSNGEPAD